MRSWGLSHLKKGGPLSHRPVIVHVALDTNKGDLLRAPVVYLLYHDTDCVPPLDGESGVSHSPRVDALPPSLNTTLITSLRQESRRTHRSERDVPLVAQTRIVRRGRSSPVCTKVSL